MRTKVTTRSYDEILKLLRDDQFDVREGVPVAGQNGATGVFVSKYGAGALLTRNTAPKSKDAMAEQRHSLSWITHPGWLLGGEISTLLDRGYQKVLTTSKLTVAATADALKAVHRFEEELREIIGEPSLYNESLGSTSDSYMYDRVKGRDLPEEKRPTPAWELPGRR